MSHEQNTTQPRQLNSWELWNSLKIARMPLLQILHPNEIARQRCISKFTLDDSAFVHRMFSLFFGLEYQPLRDVLTKEELIDLDAFLAAFKALPWKEIPTHPHISQLDDIELLSCIRSHAKKLDVRLTRRTSYDPISIMYRIVKRWPLIEPKLPTQPTLPKAN